jgi:hypothetical protein
MGMRIRIVSAVVAFLMILCFLLAITTVCSAQSTPSFQSVSGEFARQWIDGLRAQNSQPVQESKGDGTDLWNWGSAPKGSKIENGKLLTDPNYLRPQLNLSGNWLGDTYTDPDTGMPIQIYLDPFTGKRTYTYLNPSTGQPVFSYYAYLDEKTGKTVYAYTDPRTGNAIYSEEAPIDLVNELSNGLALQTGTDQNGPWIRL